MYFYINFQIAVYMTSRVSDPQKLFYEAVRFFSDLFSPQNKIKNSKLNVMHF